MHKFLIDTNVFAELSITTWNKMCISPEQAKPFFHQVVMSYCCWCVLLLLIFDFWQLTVEQWLLLILDGNVKCTQCIYFCHAMKIIQKCTFLTQ